MRLRKKKNHDRRMAAVTSVLIPTPNDELDFRLGKTEHLIDMKEMFGNGNPVRVEVGCGRGGFVAEAARREPDVNFIAVERSEGVALSACEAILAAELSNVRVMICRAEYLERYIAPASVERIYLNFSCPYPKKRQAAHRLTHPRFLEIYRKLLTVGGELHQKTDDRALFAFSVESLSAEGFTLKNVSLDLHADGMEDNIETEYEKKFSALGKPIYRLEAYIKKDEGKNNDKF